MSESSGEKQFEATPSRLAKAKRDGNIPRSAEFSANAAFIAAAIGTCFVVPQIGTLARSAIATAARGATPTTTVLALLDFALIPMAAAAAGGLLAGFIQTGGLHMIAVVPKFEKLNPAEGFKRMFSRETLTQGARGLVAFAIAVGAIVPSLRDLFSASTSASGPVAFGSVAWAGAQHVVFAAAAVGMCFAAAEYGVARQAWLKKLRMSFEELKRDMKEQEGDPHARSRRKSLHRSMVRGSLAKVKEASFVVVNPTHIAIALQYNPPEVPVPTVLVRAADDGALRVRELANEHRIPIIENIPLARALYRDAEVGTPIPHAHYVAVAEIVAALTRSTLRHAQDDK